MPSNAKYRLIEDVDGESKNAIKFSLRKESIFYRRLRIPLIVLTLSTITWYGLVLCKTSGLFEQSIGNVTAYLEKKGILQLTNIIRPDYMDKNGGGNIYIFESVMIVLLIIILMVLFNWQESEDTLLIMRDIGIQLTSNGGWKFSGNRKETFIPRKSIIDLVVHEAFHGYGEVIFYLCVLKKPNNANNDSLLRSHDDQTIYVVFPNILPSKEILIKVWKTSRKVLFGDSRRYWRRVPGKGLRECEQPIISLTASY